MKTNTQFIKKLLGMVLCLCMVLSYVPQTAFAEESSIVLFDGTHIVDTDTTVSSVHLNGGTLIIEEGVTLTVTGDFANNDGHIVNNGTITVLGTGHCFPSNHVYNTIATGSSCETMTCAICKRPGTHTMNSDTGRCEKCSEFVAEAKIGSIYYQDLWIATEDAESGDTVILQRSLAGVVQISISSDKKITLDLNGFDLLSQIVQNGSATSAVYVKGELNLINSDTDNTSTVEGVQCAIDVFGKLIVGENIECTSAGNEMRINSGIVDLSKADCENWRVLANGADLTVGENLLLPENWKLKQDGTVVETVSNGETATIEPPVQSYNLWVGGVEVTANKTSGEGWSYDQATGTLTLNGASITSGSYADAIIYTKDALNIVLNGNNTLSGSNFGIYAESFVNISGDGHLTAVGHWDGIQAHGNVTVNSGSITFKGESSYGIKAEGNTLTVNGGYVTADGGINGSGINASTVVLGSSSHLVVTHKSAAVWGTINAADGLCRTSADGDFSNTIAASGTYFEYMGSDHVTYTNKNAQDHTVSCAHGISFETTHEYENGVCVCTAEDPMYGCDFIVTGDTANYSWDKTNKVLTINGGNVTVSNKDKNTATTHRIYIQGTANVTLDGVNISTGTGAPIEIRDYNDTNVTLTLSGSNTLISQAADKAAIHKTRGQQSDSSSAAILTINGSGSLTAVGGNDAAGIGGGGHRGDAHNIIIDSGTISATGNGWAAGIGSSDDGSTWNIVINGGNVTANGMPGIGANTDNWQGVKDAAITGGMVTTNSYKGSTPTGGLVSTDGGKTYKVCSNYTLSQNLTIADDGKLTVAEGAELTVADGVTLTNEGVIVNDGTISGNLVNEGTLYNKGTLPANVGGSVYEQYVKVNNGSGTGTYTEGSTVTITADAPASGKMFTGWTIELGTITLTDSTKAVTTFTMPEGCVIVNANYADIVAAITDSNGDVKYYSDGFRAQEDWTCNGGTLTVYSDDFRLEHMDAPDGSVLDLNGHSVEPMMLHIRNSCTIQNGTIIMWRQGVVGEDAVVTFKDVTISKEEDTSREVEIYNDGTIVDAGLTLNGVTISGGSVKLMLTENNTALSGIPEGGYIYDGNAHEPGVKVNGSVLVKDVDYTVNFTNSSGGNSIINAGTVTMTITGIGSYTGVVTKTYTIAKAAITPGVTLDGWTYGENEKTPVVTGNIGNGTVTYLYKVKGAEDSTYVSEVPTNAGAYTVKAVIAATDNYHGATATADFEIAKAATVVETENTAKVENVTVDNVTLDNKTELEKAKADLEKVLADNSGNYTEAGKKAVEAEIRRIEAALKAIENAVAVKAGIGNLPATVEPDDDETIAKIEEAKKAYDGLTEHEKSLIDEATKVKLVKLLLDVVAYDIINGDGSTWTMEGEGTLTFVANGSFAKFVGIMVDGKTVDKIHYEAKSGSTIITLKASYLDTLPAGEHSITVVYTDGETEGAFKIQAKSSNPETGDNSGILLWTAMLLMSIAAMAVLAINHKRFAYKPKYSK